MVEGDNQTDECKVNTEGILYKWKLIREIRTMGELF